MGINRPEFKKNALFYLFLGFFLLITLPLAFAQEAQITGKWTMKWEECLLEAYNNNPDLKSARESVKAALSDKRSAITDYLPQVTGNIDQNVVKSPHVKHLYSTEYELSASQLIFDSFKTPANILSQAKLSQAAREAYRGASADVLFELRSNFVELLRSQRLIEITEEIAKRRQINVNMVNLRYEGGRENKGALLRAQANLSQAKFEIEQAKRFLRVNQRKLNQTLGRKSYTPIEGQGNFDIQPIDDTIDVDTIAEQHPTLRKALETRKSAKWTVVSTWAEFFPSLSVTASEQLKASKQWHAVNSHSWSVLVKASQPIFESGERVFALSKAKADYRQAVAEEQSAFNDVVINLEDQWAKTMDAVEQVDIRRQFLEAADLRGQVASAQYTSGTESFDDWNLIEDELSSAKKSYLDAQRDALIAIARWMQRQGLGFEHGLQKS